MAWSIVPLPVLMPSPGAWISLVHSISRLDILIGCYSVRSTILQLAGHELALRRIGRFVQGLIVLVWAASMLNVEWSVGRMSLALYDPRWGLFVLWAHRHASDAGFWTTETLEIMNTLTYGGWRPQYPMAIYPAAFRRFFTFVVRWRA